MAKTGSATATEAPFPVPVTIAGVAVVTIPLSHYSELLACQRREEEARKLSERYALPPRSPIEADSQVAAFFIERFGRMDMDAIRKESAQRFGPDRTPSRTSAYDFWKRLREGKARVDAWNRGRTGELTSSGEDRRGLP